MGAPTEATSNLQPPPPKVYSFEGNVDIDMAKVPGASSYRLYWLVDSATKSIDFADSDILTVHHYNVPRGREYWATYFMKDVESSRSKVARALSFESADLGFSGPAVILDVADSSTKCNAL